MGRPREYDRAAQIEFVCERISTSGDGLATILREEGRPNYSEIMKWLAETPEFAEKYARARELQADFLHDEVRNLAFSEPDRVTDQNGVTRIDPGWVSWNNARQDAVKWSAGKLNNKKYGNKVEHGGTVAVVGLADFAANLPDPDGKPK